MSVWHESSSPLASQSAPPVVSTFIRLGCRRCHHLNHRRRFHHRRPCHPDTSHLGHLDRSQIRQLDRHHIHLECRRRHHRYRRRRFHRHRRNLPGKCHLDHPDRSHCHQWCRHRIRRNAVVVVIGITGSIAILSWSFDTSHLHRWIAVSPPVASMSHSSGIPSLSSSGHRIDRAIAVGRLHESSSPLASCQPRCVDVAFV